MVILGYFTASAPEKPVFLRGKRLTNAKNSHIIKYKTAKKRNSKGVGGSPERMRQVGSIRAARFEPALGAPAPIRQRRPGVNGKTSGRICANLGGTAGYPVPFGIRVSFFI